MKLLGVALIGLGATVGALAVVLALTPPIDGEDASMMLRLTIVADGACAVLIGCGALSLHGSRRQ